MGQPHRTRIQDDWAVETRNRQSKCMNWTLSWGPKNLCTHTLRPRVEREILEGRSKWYFLREALFTSVRTVKTGMLVRSSVRPESNYFLRRGYEGWPRAAGPWCFERSIFRFSKVFEKFWKFSKKKCSKCSYQCGLLLAKIRFWTSHDQVWWTFGELFWTFLKLWKRSFWRGLRHWKKVDELKDLGCYVRGKFYDLSWSKPVLRAPAVHGVSSIPWSVT